MYIKEFIEKFEEIFPTHLQDEWDNSGFQVGNPNEELKGILTCVDVTEEVIEEAISVGANLLISHHPLLFKSSKELNYNNHISKKVIEAIRSGLSIYSSHTSIDVNSKGLNSFVFKKLGFKSREKLIYTNDEHGYGDIDEIPSRKVWDLADQIKDRLQLDHVIFYGDEEKEVSRICLLTGSGGSFINDCVEKNIELYITADLGHHDALDALEQGLMLMDLGHFPSEKLFNELIVSTIGKMDLGVNVVSESFNEKYLRNIL